MLCTLLPLLLSLVPMGAHCQPALEPPSVEVTGSGSATAGSSYTLTCTVTLPTGVSETPTVQWEGPGLSTTGSVGGSGSTYTSQQTLNPLTLSQAGDYTCTANYTMDGETSPEGNDTLTITVTIPPPSLSVGINNNEVPYVGNDITVVCGVQLTGVVDGSDVDVAVVWRKDGSEFTGVSGRITITNPIGSGGFVQSTMSFSSLLSSDSGRYECEATVTALQGTSSPSTASQDMELTAVDIVGPSCRVTADFSSAIAGSIFALTCTVTLPIVVSVTPIVQWEGPGLSTAMSVWGSGSNYTSLLVFNPLRLSYGGFYTCSATYTVNGTISPKGSDRVFIFVRIPPPSMTWGIDDNEVPYVGNDITVVCGVQLTGVVDGDDVGVVVKWFKNRSEFTGVSGRVTITDTIGSGGFLQSTVLFRPLLSSDSGRYDCEATVTPNVGLPMSSIASLDKGLEVVVPSVVVESSPASVRILNVSPYNQFTVTCTARAEVEGETVPLEMTVDWVRRSDSFSDVSSTEYETTGSPEDGYQSILNTTETDAGNIISYDCRARLVVDNSVQGTNDTTLEVVGPTNPVIPDFVTVLSVGETRATIQWTVPFIAYTPETYVVEYGTSQDSLDLTSDPQHSGPDITVTDVTYSVQLSNLEPATYHYRVVATNTAGTNTSNVKSFMMTVILPSAPPRGFSHTVVSGVPDVRFNWSPPPEDTTNGAITHYTITCDSDSGQETESSSDLELTISTLAGGTEYMCTISASTTAGEGPQSEPIQVLTVPAAPQASMLVVREDINPVGVLATWNAVKSATSYTIQVVGLRLGTKLSVSSIVPSYIITSEAVGGYEMIRVEVMAVNSAGYGPTSQPSVERTPPIIPGMVGEPSFTGVGDDAVRVSWERPDHPNGIISGYRVTVDYYEHGHSQIYRAETDDKALSTVIQQSTLKPGVPYNGTVVAINQVGHSQGEPQLFYTRELVPQAVKLLSDYKHSRTGGHLFLMWEELSPVESRGFITGYQVVFSERTDDGSGQGACQIGECKLFAGATGGCCRVPPHHTFINITGLDPSKDYTVTVSASNGAGQGEKSELLTTEGVSSENGSSTGIEGGILALIILLITGLCVTLALILILGLHCKGSSNKKTVDFAEVVVKDDQVAIPTTSNPATKDENQSHTYEMEALNESLPQFNSTVVQSSGPCAILGAGLSRMEEPVHEDPAEHT